MVNCIAFVLLALEVTFVGMEVINADFVQVFDDIIVRFPWLVSSSEKVAEHQQRAAEDHKNNYHYDLHKPEIHH
jgi:hypothetical protein